MPGSLALIGVLAIMIIILAVLSLVVVKALAESPWGTFTIAADHPDRAPHGRLHALHPARGASVKPR